MAAGLFLVLSACGAGTSTDPETDEETTLTTTTDPDNQTNPSPETLTETDKQVSVRLKKLLQPWEQLNRNPAYSPGNEAPIRNEDCFE